MATSQQLIKSTGTWWQVLLMVSVLVAAGCGGKPALKSPDTARTVRPSPAQPARPTPIKSEVSPTAPAELPVKAVPQTPPQKTSTLVKVFYATDRARSSQGDPYKMFGSKRGTLGYGACEIAVPTDQPTAKADPGSAAGKQPDKAEFRPALRRIAPRESDRFMSQVRMAVAKSPRRSAFVFVHGYNVSFAEAARRTAQLSVDLGFDGAPIFFSWPSKARKDAFAADEAEVEWAQPDLKEFLKELAQKSKARNIYLIGHSMGNRALTKAYLYLSSERPELAKQFREVILVAPDHDADQFRRDIAPGLVSAGARTTLYTSSQDPALNAASKFQDYLRAGDSGPSQPIYEGIETIDASRVNTSLTGHAHVTDRSSVLSDIYRVIREGKRAGERSGLQAVNDVSGRYWRLKKR